MHPVEKYNDVPLSFNTLSRWKKSYSTGRKSYGFHILYKKGLDFIQIACRIS